MQVEASVPDVRQKTPRHVLQSSFVRAGLVPRRRSASVAVASSEFSAFGFQSAYQSASQSACESLSKFVCVFASVPAFVFMSRPPASSVAVPSPPIPRSVPRVGFSKRSVGCVVASCKRPLRPVASASGRVLPFENPKSVLKGAFSQSRRAALRNVSRRILERLAGLRPGNPGPRRVGAVQ